MSAKPIRILHCVGRMNYGGVETWLMHVLRNIDRKEFHMDFLVHAAEPGAYDREIQDMGSRVIPCLYPQNPLSYGRKLSRTLLEYGPYDVIHSHVHHFSGYILRIAQRSGVRIRIAHSHSDTSHEARSFWLRRKYLELTRSWISRYATVGLGASSKAAEALWGIDWKTDPRWRIVYCGVDFGSPYWLQDGTSVRAEFGIPHDAFVVGHVGRLQTEKNHTFLLKVFSMIMSRTKKSWLLMVGNGDLRGAIERQSSSLGVRNQVVFAGSRNDIPRLLRGAMDAFVFPSHYEGLPLSVIEAQAAGLPVILSDTITREVDIVPGLVTWLPLSHPPSVWADTVLGVSFTRNEISRTRAFEAVKGSPFNIAASINQMEKVYRGEFSH